MPAGRPSVYTEQLANDICERLASGESLRSICLYDDHMPNESTIYRWLLKDEEFRKKYTRAREAQADAFVEELLDIADNGSNDWMKRKDPDNPGWQFNGEHSQRTRIRIDTRKWLMSKMAPKKYSERFQQEISNPDGSLSGSNPTQVAAKLEALQKTAIKRKSITSIPYTAYNSPDGEDLV